MQRLLESNADPRLPILNAQNRKGCPGCDLGTLFLFSLVTHVGMMKTLEGLRQRNLTFRSG